MSDELFRLEATVVAEAINGVPVSSTSYAVGASNTVEAIRTAIAKLRDAPAYLPPQLVLHPYAHDNVNDVLGRPHGTPVTFADISEVLRIAWDEADDAGKARLLAASFGIIE